MDSFVTWRQRYSYILSSMWCCRHSVLSHHVTSIDVPYILDPCLMYSTYLSCWPVAALVHSKLKMFVSRTVQRLFGCFNWILCGPIAKVYDGGSPCDCLDLANYVSLDTWLRLMYSSCGFAEALEVIFDLPHVLTQSRSLGTVDELLFNHVV